jgi:hypothetical protein
MGMTRYLHELRVLLQDRLVVILVHEDSIPGGKLRVIIRATLCPSFLGEFEAGINGQDLLFEPAAYLQKGSMM